MTLAQDCGNKAELAHIQELGLTLDQAQSLVRMIGKCSHRSFPALQRFLQHDGRYFLVWELTELSLNKVFASKCPITESELAQIVWPVCRCSLSLLLLGMPHSHSFFPHCLDVLTPE